MVASVSAAMAEVEAMEVENEVFEDGQGGHGWEEDVVGEAKDAEAENKDFNKNEAGWKQAWAEKKVVSKKEAAWGTREWMCQCSKHLSNIETRMMEGEFLGHEVVRQIGLLLTSFTPPPMGDWGWLLRQAQDIGVRTMRQLVRYYLRERERESEAEAQRES